MDYDINVIKRFIPTVHRKSDKDNIESPGLGYYKSDLFVSVEEWRNIRLDELGL